MSLHTFGRFCVFLSCSSLLHVFPLPFRNTPFKNGPGLPIKFSFKTGKAYLDRYHYLGPKSPDPVIRELSNTDPVKAMTLALRDFQTFANLPVTGKLDENTKQAMLQPRCTVEDMVALASGKKTKTKPGPPATVARSQRWTKTQLTYTIKNYPKNVFHMSTGKRKMAGVPTKKEIRSAIKKAFQMWSFVSKFRFKVVKRRADINLKFVQGEHGDNYPFDGPNGTLAHAFPPPHGDVHLDSTEAFTVDSIDDGRIDLFKLATHEIGHSLGLLHVNDTKSIMYPILIFGKFKLSAGDIANIQYLYK